MKALLKTTLVWLSEDGVFYATLIFVCWFAWKIACGSYHLLDKLIEKI